MTPYYVTGAFCLASLLSFFLGRHTMQKEVEDYFDELQAEKEARGVQPSDLK
jgi:hypothetical protein